MQDLILHIDRAVSYVESDSRLPHGDLLVHAHREELQVVKLVQKASGVVSFFHATISVLVLAEALIRVLLLILI